MSEGGRVLLVCDDNKIAEYLGEQLIVEGGYTVSFESTAQSGLLALKQNNFDVVIAKFRSLDPYATELIKNVKKIDPTSIIIAFLEQPDHEASRALLKFGVYDFITKPIVPERLLLLVKKGMELHSLLVASHKLTESLKERNASLEKQNILLGKRIEESTKNLTRLYENLRSIYMRTIKVLAHAIEAKDRYTHSHSENVARYAVAIAREMRIADEEVEIVREACELHDLGKIGIDDSILSKPTGLTETEWEQVRRHPITGAQILEPLTFLNNVIELVRQHHEHYDGSGYPDGRRGEDIILGARIIHLADAYEAMTSARSYRKIPLSKEEATLEIKRNSGTQFDPKVVEAFLRIVDTL